MCFHTFWCKPELYITFSTTSYFILVIPVMQLYYLQGKTIERVVQLNWLYWSGTCQIMPLIVWPITALGCNHQSTCMPQLQPGPISIDKYVNSQSILTIRSIYFLVSVCFVKYGNINFAGYIYGNINLAVYIQPASQPGKLFSYPWNVT